MAWVRIDDGLHSHPKFTAAWEANESAVGLWLFGASYAGEYMTDGRIDPTFTRRFFRSPKRMKSAVNALTTAGLWVPNGTGWEMHDWAKYNPTRASVEARRAADRERKRRR